MKEKVIYTRWLMRELVKAGFPVIRVEKNPKKPEFECYVFTQTPEFDVGFTNIVNR